MKYVILKEENHCELETLVNNMILEGWKPIGSVSIVAEECNTKYYAYQAMIHPDKEISLYDYQRTNY